MRSLKLHVSVENNDSDVEGGEQMKPACNLRRLYQKRMNENEVLGGKKKSKGMKRFPCLVVQHTVLHVPDAGLPALFKSSH